MANSENFSSRTLSMDPLVGFRYFIRSATASLHSIYKAYEYVPGENVAECLKGTSAVSKMISCTSKGARPSIARTCSCGFHAYHFEHEHAAGYVRAGACGVVEGYGRIAFGSVGFRAEKLQILALVMGEVDDDEFVPIEWNGDWRGIPVFRSIPSMLREFPLSSRKDVDRLIELTPR